MNFWEDFFPLYGTTSTFGLELYRLGVATSIFIIISPWRPVQNMLASRQVGKNNLTLYPMYVVFLCPVMTYFRMVVNSMAWLLYSFVLNDGFIFWTNGFGWVLGLYYTMAAYGVARANAAETMGKSNNTASQESMLIKILLGGTAFIWYTCEISFGV